MIHEAITHTILEACFEVANELGSGFLESVYERALLIALRSKGLVVTAHQPIQVYFRNECVGDFFADLMVEGKVVIELKAVTTLAPEHQAQLINYLNATGLDVGLLVNFGPPKIEYRRLTSRTLHQLSHPHPVH